MTPCPLCHSSAVKSYQQAPFFRCHRCHYVFKDPAVRLPADMEKKRYGFHNNRIEDLEYVQFLSPVVDEVKKRMPSGSMGVDYGCGPGPVLGQLLDQAGYQVSNYDPFFSPRGLENLQPLDFVTCTEAAEHFFNPGQEFETMFSLLQPNGILVVMSEWSDENREFKDWYYAKDPTHVGFFSYSTLEWIASQRNKRLDILSHRLSVFY